VSASGTVRNIAKSLVFAAATVAVTPMLASYWLRSLVLGRHRALEGSTQVLALFPGLPGHFLRRAFLSRVLRRCHRSVTVEFGTIFSDADAQIDEGVYVGPRCHLGRVHIQRDVMLAAGVHVPSGQHTHGTADVATPMRDQPGARTMVTIGEGAWVGSAAVVMADVGEGTIVGAGAVVTKRLPPRAVAGGVPARILRVRQDPNAGDGRAIPEPRAIDSDSRRRSG
jgi:acetyltransferase-like isoleucine patch superfamily enzyme